MRTKTEGKLAEHPIQTNLLTLGSVLSLALSLAAG